MPSPSGLGARIAGSPCRREHRRRRQRRRRSRDGAPTRRSRRRTHRRRRPCGNPSTPRRPGRRHGRGTSSWPSSSRIGRRVVRAGLDDTSSSLPKPRTLTASNSSTSSGVETRDDLELRRRRSAGSGSRRAVEPRLGPPDAQPECGSRSSVCQGRRRCRARRRALSAGRPGRQRDPGEVDERRPVDRSPGVVCLARSEGREPSARTHASRRRRRRRARRGRLTAGAYGPDPPI